jgi:hypothetical protein
MAVGASAANLVTPLLNVFRNVSFSGYPAIYVQLHTGDPGASGTANISVGSTTRVVVTFAAPSGTPLSIVMNSTAPAWTNGGTTETITHISLWTAVTSGSFIESILLPTPVPWVAAQVATLNSLTATGPAQAA